MIAKSSFWCQKIEGIDRKWKKKTLKADAAEDVTDVDLNLMKKK